MSAGRSPTTKLAQIRPWRASLTQIRPAAAAGARSDDRQRMRIRDGSTASEAGAAPGSGIEEIERAHDELERLAQQRAEAIADRAELLKSRENAAASDLERAANAVRDGKPMPTKRHVDPVDQTIAKLDERIAAIEAAVDQVEDELVNAVEERRAERLSELEARLDEEKARWVGVLDQAAAQLETIATTGALLNFFREFPKQPVFRSRGAGRLNIRGEGGDPITSGAAPRSTPSRLRRAGSTTAAVLPAQPGRHNSAAGIQPCLASTSTSTAASAKEATPTTKNHVPNSD